MLKKFEASLMVAFVVLVLAMASSVAWAHPGGKHCHPDQVNTQPECRQ